MREPVFQIEEINDPVEVARCKAQDERSRRNSDWLQAHWADLLPQARGKFVAVAGQEAFIADTHEEAWAMARKAHPEDDAPLASTSSPERGRESMLVVGEWRICDDGVIRPALRAKVHALNGTHQIEAFLVDSCADRTVFSANLLSRLGFPPTPARRA